jgi:hypothetical protein
VIAEQSRASSDLGFSFRQLKNGEVWVAHHGRAVTCLRGSAAIRFLSQLDRMPAHDLQQLMARVTGNYKRGNERLAAAHPRSRD